MKNLLKIIVLSSLVTTTALANTNLSIARISEVEALAQQKNYLSAYIQSVQTMNELHESAKVGQVVKEIEYTFTKIIDEVITGRKEISMSFLNPLSFFVPDIMSLTGLRQIMGWSKGSMSYTYDLTKMIVRNPEESAKVKFEEDKRFDQLRREVLHYISQNMDSLLLMKLMAAKSLDYMSKAMQQGHRFSEAEILHIAKSSLELHFLGRLMVTHCVKTNYANKKSTRTQSGSTGILDKVLSTFSITQINQQFAHSVKTCESDLKTVDVDTVNGGPALSINMTRLDMLLLEMIKFSYAKIYFGQSEMNQFPTFNNPYYKN